MARKYLKLMVPAKTSSGLVISVRSYATRLCAVPRMIGIYASCGAYVITTDELDTVMLFYERRCFK